MPFKTVTMTLLFALTFSVSTAFSQSNLLEEGQIDDQDEEIIYGLAGAPGRT